jgi:hypothetical protein
MPRTVSPDVEPVVGVLRGAIDVGDGGTEEQQAVLRAIVTGFFGRPDLDIGAVEPVAPDDAAEAVAVPDAQRRVREMLVLLESCRHPLTTEQVKRIETYCAVLGGDADDPGLTIARDLVHDGARQALADYMRFVDSIMVDIAEPTLVPGGGVEHDHPDPELAARLRGFHMLSEGTLGHEYVEFYRRNQLTYPGDDPNSPAVMVAHDMTHVIAGYEPTGPGEISLGAFLLAMNDSNAHWIGFLGNLAIHEAGYFTDQGFVGKTATLTRPGATDMLAEAFQRGAQCTADFSAVDHLSLADQPIADVRAEFGVPFTARRG